MKKFDTKCTDEITCPYCGYEMSDSWEFSNDTYYTCDECGKKYDIEVEHSVSYSTYKKDCKNDEHEFEQQDKKSYFLDGEKEVVISDTDYSKGQELKKPEEEWKYSEIFRCKNCEKVEYREISKEEFIKKYPKYYEWSVSR